MLQFQDEFGQDQLIQAEYLVDTGASYSEETKI
jgi:hypothetical protein